MSTPKVKEKFGCVTSHYTPIVDMPEGSHPVYGVSIDMGAAVKAYVAVTLANAKLPGDDVIQLEANEFISASLSAETLLSDLEVDSKLFGARYVDGELSNNKDDEPSCGAYDYIQKLKTKTGTVYRAVFLYYVKPMLGDDNSDTKGEQISFAHNAVNYTVYVDNTGDWRAKKDFTSQDDAEAWLRSKRGEGGYYAVNVMHSGSGDSTPGIGTTYVASGGELEISFVSDPTKLLDNGTDVTAAVSSHKYTLSEVTDNHDIIAVWTT